MSRAIAIFATTVTILSFATAAPTQSAPLPSIASTATDTPTGSAATLQGIEARSININFNIATPATFELPTSTAPAANPASLLGLEKIEIKPGLETINNPSNVYPADNTGRGGGVQVLYRIDQK